MSNRAGKRERQARKSRRRRALVTLGFDGDAEQTTRKVGHKKRVKLSRYAGRKGHWGVTVIDFIYLAHGARDGRTGGR